MKKKKQPNLLYICSDQHTYSVLGCYGDPLVQTPNLDQIAGCGVTFDNVYCPAPVCGPSRMSMLTGVYPYEHQMWSNDHILDTAIPTFAHAMGIADYSPVSIGRLHMHGPDQLHGYVERLVGDHEPNYRGLRPVDHGMLSGTENPGRISLQKSGIGQNSYQLHDEDVAAGTVALLNQLGEKKRKDSSSPPFSISVGFMLPHPPYVAHKEDFLKYENRMTLPRIYEKYNDVSHPYMKWLRQNYDIKDVPEDEILRARTAYWGLVDRLDKLIGEILAALRENGFYDDTIVLYTSDHGEHMGEHGLWWKQSFYENSVKVPAVLSWPGVIPNGIRCNRVISSLDLNATMLDMLGAPELPNSHGRSLMPILLDESSEWQDVAFSEYCDQGWYQRMIRFDDWKLNYYHGQPTQLFNLKDDPDELCDLSEEKAHKELIDLLKAKVLDGWEPEKIEQIIAKKEADSKIIYSWAQHTKQSDKYRWQHKAEMDYLL